MNHQHHSVELQCPSTGDSTTIQLPSTGDSPDWALNLHFIIQAISTQFEFASTLKESEWLLSINGMMINRHDAVQFGALLSKQISPPAILQIIVKPSMVPSLHAKPQQTDPDDLINEILDDMTSNEIHSLKGQISNVPSQPATDFSISWNHLIACIKHEMWPKLAFVIQAMINNDDDLRDDECVHKVLEKLKTERHLPSEEYEYLKKLITRTKQFNPSQYLHNKNENDMDIDINHYDGRDHHDQIPGLSRALRMDIFDAHKVFMFTNFNFREYTIDHFKRNLTQALGDTYVDKVSFTPRFDLYPVYIVDDDIFRVLEYHFSVSCFVNTLKHNL
eukprot:280118_1